MLWQAFQIKGPPAPLTCLYCQYMAGARLFQSGPDFSRSCGAQQTHTSAGTALAAALARPTRDLEASNKDRLWLPARAACTGSLTATPRDGNGYGGYGAPTAFTGSAAYDDVPTQRLAAAPAAPPAEPRRELRRPSTGRPPASAPKT